MSRTLRTGAYALVAVIALFELVVMWLMLHPDVPPDYRAYFIDKTTTCLNHPVAGTYNLGTIVPFTPEGRDAAKPIKVCGWEGPVGDGTHAVGTSSRLRFTYPEPATALTLELQLVAVKRADHPSQRVEIVLNGETVDTVTATHDAPQDFSISIPPSIISAASGRLDLELRFPDAIKMGPTDPDNRYRSIKLLSAALVPA